MSNFLGLMLSNIVGANLYICRWCSFELEQDLSDDFPVAFHNFPEL